MTSTLTVIVGLLAISAGPQPTSAGPPAVPQDAASAAPLTEHSGAAGGSWHAHPYGPVGPGMDPYGEPPYVNDHCAHCPHGGRDGRPCHDWCKSPCDMSLRFQYWPKDHGYYYFRPYHMVHVAIQRDLAASWGEDPRNPYDHKVFNRVYEALRAEEAAKAEVLPPAQEMQPEVPPIPPPPVPMPPSPKNGDKPAAPKDGPDLTPKPATPGAARESKQGSSRRVKIQLQPASVLIDPAR
jgi:hypothetical protein